MKELNISLETPNKLSTTSHAKGDLEVNISCLAWIEHLRDKTFGNGEPTTRGNKARALPCSLSTSVHKMVKNVNNNSLKFAPSQ
jgi:hypothetical protein